MDKHYTYHLWTRIRPLKPQYFLAVALVGGMVSVFALRQNNLQMASLRDAVYTTDKNGGDVQKALQNLQVYVTSHMNTDLSAGPNAPYPPIQLKYTYDRLVTAAGASASAANSKIYTDAQHYCEQQDPVDFSGHNRVPCIQQYVQSHGVSLSTISDSLYKFDFLSPTWSPDLAGWSLVVTVLGFLLFVGVWLARRWLRAISG
jgi:hypothetical protein